ncbi:MAG: rRNA maturation RNase YbeY [Phycisphaerales bacterium]
MRPTAEIELLDACGSLRPDELRQLTDLARRAMEQLPNTGSVRVRIVDDREMTEAHERYANAPGTTDVLTFDLAADTTGDPTHKALDADLIICHDQAARQAREHGHEPVRELLLYIIHGVLHCLGYDDHDEEGFNSMHTREDQILAAIGVGTTFFKDPPVTPGAAS